MSAPDFADLALPAAKESERAVLSACLQEPERCVPGMLARLPERQAWFFPEHQLLAVGMRDLTRAGDPVDLVTLASYLQRKGRLEQVGGAEYLAHVASAVPTTANFEAHLEAVADCWARRRLIYLGGELSRMAGGGEEATAAIIAEHEQSLAAVSESRADRAGTAMPQALAGAIKTLGELASGEAVEGVVPTGFVDLDRLLTWGGLPPEGLVVIAARPGVGKTAMGLALAAAAARAGTPVLMISLEMSADSLALRMLCSEARTNQRDWRDGRVTEEDQLRLGEAAERMRDWPLVIDDMPGISSMQLRQKARRMQREQGLGLVVIDYLQLMRAEGMNRQANREQEVARMSADCKALARELGVPVVLLAQLNRQAEVAERPRLAHLRESGAIEQDADIVALLHGNREVDMGRSAAEIEREGRDVELIVAKQRNGELGLIPLAFFGQWTRFEARARVRDEDVPEGGGGRGYTTRQHGDREAAWAAGERG